jgi:DNA adenine methylase
MSIRKSPLNHQQSGILTSDLSPFLKWPGGKSSELEKISKSAPKIDISRFIEPFVGGGSVLLSVDPTIPAMANDICPELIDLYQSGSKSDQILETELLKISDFWEFINTLDSKWLSLASEIMDSRINTEQALSEILSMINPEIQKFAEEFNKEFHRRITKDLPLKLSRIKKLQIEKTRLLPLEEFANNLEGSVRAAFYMAIRKRYNNARVNEIYGKERTADFLFLREFSYASMFRFNSKGEFNVPYGGISYNRKPFRSKINRLFGTKMKERLANTNFFCTDFENFLESVKLKKSDFIFVDPPYDSDFTDYDGREFRNNDQERLARCLDKSSSMVMVVIGDTDLIRALYKSPKWKIQEDDMQYKWTIKSRNKRAKTHLTITNY